MSATPNEPVSSTVATNGKLPGPAQVSPDYASFGRDLVRDASEAVAGPTFAFLRGLNFPSLALVLTQAGMAACAGTLAWPSGDPTGYRTLGACAVCLMMAATGLVAFLTHKGKTSAASTEDRDHQAPDAGPGGAGPRAAGGA